MNPLYKLWALCLLLCLSVSYSYAQTDTTEKKSYLKIGINFLSNGVYLGRTDTVTTPAISPNINYTFGFGLYFSGSLDYITNRQKNKVDGGNIEAGYNYTGDDNFEAGASFTKLFYNSASTQVSSSISGVFNAYADYNLFDIVTPAFSVSYNLNKSGTSGDLFLNPNLSHDFDIDGVFNDDDNLKISPQAGLFAGSQNFYADYLERKGRLNRKTVNAAYNNYYSALGDFKLLDYEFSAPVEYTFKSFTFTFTPTYAFGQNSLPQSTDAEKLITKLVEVSSPYKPSVFYFETGISFKF